MERMIVKIGKNYLFLKTAEIDWIEREDNYLRIHKGVKSYLYRASLSSIEQKLNPSRFVRINRSIIVNIDRIAELRSLNSSNYEVVLENEQSWIWSRRYRRQLLRMMNI